VDFFDETMRLDVLPAHEAIQVFQAHTGGKPADSAEVGELLKMIGYHTLMTELLAKTYKQCLQFGTVGELHAYLKERSLQDQQLSKKIYVDRQATTLYAHLSAVFSLASLTETETWVLKQCAVLPTAPHQAKDFLTWIQDTALAYENALLFLTEKGWLQTDNRLAYSLHPFLQLFLHQELKPTLPDCEKMWYYFGVLMGSDKVEAHPLAHQWTITVGEAMVQYIDFTNHEEKQGVLWNKIYNVYRLLGDYPNAIKCAKEGLAINKATVGEAHKDYATALICLGFIYNRQGNYVEALPLYQEALQIDKEVLGERHPDYATSLNNLASLYHNQGKYAEALPLFQESLQIRKEVLGERHPDIAQSLNNLAGLYYNQGNYTEALHLFQEALPIWKEVLGERHPNYATALNNLAGLYDNQGNYAEALPLYQESLQIRKEILGERHPDTAISLHNIGTLYFQQEDYTQARTYFTEAYSICLEKLGEQHPHTQLVKKWLDALPSLP
jgi:tetratricopeptide (TPR) repeat protein